MKIAGQSANVPTRSKGLPVERKSSSVSSFAIRKSGDSIPADLKRAIRLEKWSEVVQLCKQYGLKWAEVLRLCKQYGLRPPRLRRSFLIRSVKHASIAKLAEPALPTSKERVAPALDESAFAPGPRARAMLRGLEMAQEDLRSSGGSFDLEQVRRLMHGVTRQRIDKCVRDGRLLAIPGPSNKRRFPAVQFKDDGAVVEGMQDVQKALPTNNAFAVLNFLIRPDSRLDGRKPIDLLKTGEVDLVIEAARRVGEQGA
jgi:hypothetical protein